MPPFQSYQRNWGFLDSIKMKLLNLKEEKGTFLKIWLYFKDMLKSRSKIDLSPDFHLISSFLL